MVLNWECKHSLRAASDVSLWILSIIAIFNALMPDRHAEGKPIPTELKREEAALKHDIELEDDNTAVPRTHMDDEYAHAGERDPRILVTTSRDPSSRLMAFAKELRLIIPNADRMNRGGQVTNHPHPFPPCLLHLF